VAVRKIANDIFDFGEIAKRSMARHWQPLSEAQRNEFVGLFADLLERSYISKIETYGGEKIQYTAERADGEYATVSTKIVTKNGTEVPVDYRLIKRSGDRWLVYDVSIEGVSLVSNYRTQFNKIIQTSSYNELVSKLRNKQDELLAEDKKKKL
jgi:phospholipid transport system substrate-binding protein